jgi:hypothetical protein
MMDEALATGCQGYIVAMGTAVRRRPRVAEARVSAAGLPASVRPGLYAPIPAGAEERDRKSHRNNFTRALRELMCGDQLSALDGLIKRQLVEYLAANFDPRRYAIIEGNVRAIVQRRVNGF